MSTRPRGAGRGVMAGLIVAGFAGVLSRSVHMAVDEGALRGVRSLRLDGKKGNLGQD